MKKVIIFGGGLSVRDGIEKGLWLKIKSQEIWSLNSVFKTMPYLPKKELWVDATFFKHEVANLQTLSNKGVILTAKKHPKMAMLKDKITQYETTRERSKYFGKEAINRNIIFCGAQGLVGMFALSIAIAEKYNEIFLLGFNHGIPKEKMHERKTHYYQNDIKDLKIYSSGAGKPEVYLMKDGRIRKEMKDYEVYLQEKDIKIWNVSPSSNIPFFPKISYGTFFEKIK